MLFYDVSLSYLTQWEICPRRNFHDVLSGGWEIIPRDMILKRGERARWWYVDSSSGKTIVWAFHSIVSRICFLGSSMRWKQLVWMELSWLRVVLLNEYKRSNSPSLSIVTLVPYPWRYFKGRRPLRKIQSID